ncbi:thioredoxin protein disulfide isomerase [Lactarius tabidus]
MLLPYLHLLTLTLALVPSYVSAALYPKNSQVKMIDARGFKNAMKENRTSVVAFVASWCGHCKAMIPEYSKAALGLHPLIPAYAVDCDENRALCAEQGVKGFPTVKLFPRGKDQAPILFQHSERTASAFFYFATRRVPHKNKKLYHLEEIEPWVNNKIDQTRVMLLSKAKDIPLMWKVLANKYRDDFAFANHRDRKGKSSVALGYEAGTKKESKILIYPAGSTKPVLFEGTLKYDSISKFFDSILDGTVNLSSPSSQAQEETYEPTPEEEEIERKQEAQRLELLHGGFSNMIDFEEALKKHGPDFHGPDGYGASLGDKPKKGEKADTEEETQDEYEREEDPIFRAVRIQREKAEQKTKEALKGCTAKVDDAEQVVLEMCTAADTNDFATGTEATQESPSSEEPDSDSESVPGPEKAAPTYAEHIKDEL